MKRTKTSQAITVETKILAALVIGISVPDLHAASERFEKYDVEFIKRPGDGSMTGLVFIKDPDGYWIERGYC